MGYVSSCHESRLLSFTWKFAVYNLEHPHRCSVCYPAKIFLTSKFSYLLFLAIPVIRLKGGLQIVGTTNCKPAGPIIIISQSKTGHSTQIILITLFSSRCTTLLCFLPVSANWANVQEKNHFPEPNLHMLTFLHLIFMCRVTYRAPVGILLEHLHLLQ
jgi:hypothetical protein